MRLLSVCASRIPPRSGLLGVLRHSVSAAGYGDAICGRRHRLGYRRRVGRARPAAALRLVPIYVVAAALAASIAVTGIVSAWVLSTRLSAAEWTAVGVVCASLSVLALAAGPGHFRHAPAGLGWALLGVDAALFLVGAFAGRLGDRGRGFALGLCAGSGFGVVEIAVRLLDVIDPTKRAFYINPALYALLAGSAAGFLFLTSALQRGSVTTTVAAMVVGETIAPALVGVLWLGRIPLIYMAMRRVELTAPRCSWCRVPAATTTRRPGR